MMKKIIYSITLLVLLVSCTKDFDTINVNPNSSQTASETLLLPTVIFSLANHMVNEAHNFGEVTAQYGARYQFNDLDLYRWQPDDRFWAPLYSLLQDVNDIEKIAVTNGNANYEAIAKILKAYIFSLITDAYGDVPMSQANKAVDGVLTPVYDSQQSIYESLFTLLKEANASINTSETVTGDRLYQGNMMKWKKFANSLRLRLLLHVSNTMDVKGEMAEIVNNTSTYPLFASNDDNAVYAYSGTLPDIAPVAAPGGGRGFEYYLNIPTTHFINTLSKNKDPRLDLWVSARDCDATDPNCTQDNLQGLAPGQLISDIGAANNYSRRAVKFFESATLIQGIFMTYSEVNFILAEAREKGMIASGAAQGYYNAGVTASFDQWGVQMPTDFLTATIPYDNTTDRLYEQKWLALYHTGFEAWSDWKRTSKPAFIQAGPATINGGKVPKRLLYPALEQSVNPQNYSAAADAMNGDNINSSAWWW